MGKSLVRRLLHCVRFKAKTDVVAEEPNGIRQRDAADNPNALATKLLSTTTTTVSGTVASTTIIFTWWVLIFFTFFMKCSGLLLVWKCDHYEINIQVEIIIELFERIKLFDRYLQKNVALYVCKLKGILGKRHSSLFF